MLQRAALQPGNTALSIFLASSSPHRIAPPRGPRSVLCVVNVTTSATPTGLGCAPAAIRPAGWAASNMNSAPTESAISRNGCGSIIASRPVEPATMSAGCSVLARCATWSKSMTSPGFASSSDCGVTP